jgi:hypothetical protein
MCGRLSRIATLQKQYFLEIGEEVATSEDEIKTSKKYLKKVDYKHIEEDDDTEEIEENP